MTSPSEHLPSDASAPTTGEHDTTQHDTTQHDTTRRDRKKLATRQALRCAALDLVATRGYAHVTVEDIAEAADVSPRTFFNYFPSKEAAVLGDDELLGELRTEILGRPPEETAFQAVEQVVCSHIAARSRHPDSTWRDPGELYRRMRAAQDDPHLRVALVAHMAAFERVVADAVAERTGVDTASDPYPALLASAAMAVARVALLYWARGGGANPAEDAVRAGFRALSSGFADSSSLTEALTKGAP
ncbi:MAG: acyl-CoA-like ligand-binding transcription factor [Acidimicrobiales bacterium]